MSIRLRSLEVIPQGATGWGSDRLEFGDGFTLIRGPNGSGKTPVMQSIAYCFGYPVRFRKGIYENCRSVKIEVSSEGRHFLVERQYLEKGFSASITNPLTGEVITLTNEAEASEWFLSLNAIPSVALTNSDGKSSALIYTSTLFPTFYVDQDEGWSNVYKAHNSFIKDQPEEMLRIILGLPAKNPFHLKDALVSERKSLQLLDEQLKDRRMILDELKKAVSLSEGADINRLRLKKEKITGTLGELRGGLAGLGQATAIYDAEISGVMRQIAKIEEDLNEFDSRSGGIKTIKAEIESEIETLSLNVDAADALRSFCERPGCQVFCGQAESYGKSLLYLKDQLKDLETTISNCEDQYKKANLQREALRAKLEELKKKRQAALSQSGFSDLVALIESHSRDLIEVETHLSFAAKINDLQEQVNALYNRREVSRSRVEELQSETKNRTGLRTSDIKTTLGENVAKWIRVLRAKNVDGIPNLDERFRLNVGTEPLKAFSGSTRTRLILAYHAAVLETSLEVGGNHPGVLLLDTPKQNELKVEDLRGYYNELKKLAGKFPNRVQAVLSFVDADIEPQGNDVTWLPKRNGPDGKSYFGSGK